MTAIKLVYFGEALPPAVAKALGPGSKAVERHPARDNWISAYLKWLPSIGQVPAVIPRFVAEHEYGPMPIGASVYRHGSQEFVIPGQLPIDFDWSARKYRSHWSEVATAAADMHELYVCLNQIYYDRSPRAANSLRGFVAAFADCGM